MSSRLWVCLLLASTCAAACGSKPLPPPPPTGGGKTVDASTTGAISGRAIFQGARPAPEKIRMSIDKGCIEGTDGTFTNDAVSIAPDGGLANVFVYVKDGLDPAYSFDAPTTAVDLTQKNCHYSPRVFGIRAGQAIDVVNGDETLHNVHALPMSNQEFNQGEGHRGQRMTATFTVPEVMVRFKCDVHPWMSAYVGVMAHPFFAVTSADGSFEIKGLPPGTYTVEAWHERFGRQTAKLVVGPHQTQTASFTFAAGH